VRVVQPALQVVKTAPDEVLLGETIVWKIAAANTGSGTLRWTAAAKAAYCTEVPRSVDTTVRRRWDVRADRNAPNHSDPRGARERPAVPFFWRSRTLTFPRPRTYNAP
jgi:hypothetical protein